MLAPHQGLRGGGRRLRTTPQTPPPATGWRGFLRADNPDLRRGSRSAAGSYPILLIALIRHFSRLIRHGSAFLSDTLAIWADLGPKSEKRIFRKSIKKRRLRFLVKRRFSGGGGNRTRVPRHFHASFYVRSRMFEFRLIGPLTDEVPGRLVDNLFNPGRGQQ